MPSLESFRILFATHDENQNRHTRDPVERAGLPFHKVACSVMYPQTVCGGCNGTWCCGLQVMAVLAVKMRTQRMIQIHGTTRIGVTTASLQVC